MNDVHPAFAAALAPFALPDAFTEAQLLEADRHLVGPARDPQFFNLHPAFAAALAPFALPDAFTEAQLLEADRHLVGPARDPQFFNRKAELAAQHHHERAVYLENKYSRDFS